MQRRYLAGQRIITSNLSEEFNRAKFSSAPSPEFVMEETENLKPRSSRTGLSKFSAGNVDIARTAPTFNDPRYSFTTLAIPTDRRTLNGLYRFFDDTDPIVGNAIQLHVEFPLSKIELTDCGVPGIQRHYEEMWNRIHGDQMLMQVATEYWRIGDCFLFGAWNEEDYMWDQFAILNPDYVTVESTWINKQPLIKLQPDESLKRIVSTGQPRALFEQLPEVIIRYVRMQKDIPLDSNNAFHLSYNKAPYEIYGKSIIKRILKLLVYEHRMHEAQFAIATRHVIPLTVVKVGDAASGWVPRQDEIDAVQELLACHDDQTEVMTENGFKLFKALSPSDRVGCFNSATSQLEYHLPQKHHNYDYKGDLFHFTTSDIDAAVTSNHRMFVNTDAYYLPKGTDPGQWKVCRADEVHKGYKFNSVVNWGGIKPSEKIELCGKKVSTKAYLKFLGWFLSEGSVSLNKFPRKKKISYTARVQISQQAGPGVDSIREALDIMGFPYGESTYLLPSGKGDYHKFNIVREFGKFMFENFAGGATKKYVPREILMYDKEHLGILLDSLMQGDGSIKQYESGIIHYDYSTTSEQLANDVFEIALKLGFSPTLTKKFRDREKTPNWSDHYVVRFSTSIVGKYPGVVKAKNGIEPIQKIPYSGKVYCLTVPTGLLITRRNGRILISGNSREIDPSFTIVYHWGINVEFYGANGKILPLQAEFDRVTKLKFLGLGISEQLLTGGGSTYAAAYASLEVLRQRYLHFQNRIESFVHNGVFETVAKMAGWYKTESLTAGYGGIGKKYGDGKEYEKWKEEYAKSFSSIRDPKDNKDFELFLQTKHAELELEETKKEFIYPKLNWDKLSLSNDQNYKNFVLRLQTVFPKAGGVKGFEPMVSKSTLYRIARLDEEAEIRQLAQEADDERNRQLVAMKKDLEFKQKESQLQQAFNATLPKGTTQPGEAGGGGAGGGEFVPEAGGGEVGGGAPPEGGEEKGPPGEEPKAPVGENPFLGVTVPPHASSDRVTKTAKPLDIILSQEETRIAAETVRELNELKGGSSE